MICTYSLIRVGPELFLSSRIIRHALPNVVGLSGNILPDIWPNPYLFVQAKVVAVNIEGLNRTKNDIVMNSVKELFQVYIIIQFLEDIC